MSSAENRPNKGIHSFSSTKLHKKFFFYLNYKINTNHTLHVVLHTYILKSNFSQL